MPNPNDRYMWKTRSGNSCPSCRQRSGQIKTYAEWQRLGLPKSTRLICSAHCKCYLFLIR